VNACSFEEMLRGPLQAVLSRADAQRSNTSETRVFRASAHRTPMSEADDRLSV